MMSMKVYGMVEASVNGLAPTLELLGHLSPEFREHHPVSEYTRRLTEPTPRFWH